MARNFQLLSKGVKGMLNEPWVRKVLRPPAERSLASAKASAPVATGAYRDSLHIEDHTTDRAVVRVVADVPYAMVVESKTGNLSRSLDAAGGA